MKYFDIFDSTYYVYVLHLRVFIFIRIYRHVLEQKISLLRVIFDRDELVHSGGRFKKFFFIFLKIGNNRQKQRKTGMYLRLTGF